MPRRRTSKSATARRDQDLVDPEWVAKLSDRSLEEARGAVEEAQKDTPFVRTIDLAHQQAGRDFYAQIRAPFELYALVRLLRPKHVVEAGVSSGVSSAYFLKALNQNHFGTLHSIDLPTRQKGATFREKEDSPVALPPGKSSGWAVPPHLRAGWDLRIGPSQELLPSLVSELDQVDLFLHDSLHTFEHATFEFTTVDPKMPSHGVLLADNTAWLGGALDRFAASKGVRALYRRGMDLGGFRKP
ncbi:MAG: class I SAM-dependent methyltransferase [Euryarchaeota archaeon]|nr:class I SAM-dependent methyltransferase [Euryarchaeota archaeon]MDE1837021.1 class I SAM-dependent methyltransferase [Euryarchaeota archaeon]MDE1879871.1 class I SAM-dependent methyltransferase [Euryarchaeota archaeon]MDE2045679.1 class I SAM-dependent methyltransferase [Thermoplasmata archaeon]